MAKTYIFRVTSSQNTETGKWIKHYKMNKLSGSAEKNIKEISEEACRMFPYTSAMDFKSDKEATDWFDTHYTGF